MIRSIPNINTSRLALRAMRPEDFDHYAEIATLPETLRNLSGPAWGRRRAWEAFLRNAGHWQMTGFGQWAVTELATRRMIGHVGFFYGTEPVGEDFDSFPEADWLLMPEAQGKGLAIEAANAAHDWHDRVIPGALVIRINLRNTASLRMADQLGYRELRRTGEGDDPVILMRRNGPPTTR